MQYITSKYLLYICITLTIVLLVSTAATIAYAKAIGHTDGTSVRYISEYKRHDIRVTSICAEGQVVLVAHSDVGQGGGLQMIQLQQDVDGKLKLMTCDLNDYTAEGS